MKYILFLAAALLRLNCAGPEPIDELNNFSVTLIDEDSTLVNFPGDFEGKVLVIGYVYTNCPDICPLITGNMKKIQVEMGNPTDVEFIGISFDPERDTPSVLKNYHKAFDMNNRFSFLTGDTTEVNKLLDRVKVRTQVSMSTTTADGREIYFLNHSDKLTVLDKKGRLMFEYGGSMAPPKIVIEDINTIR